MGEVGRGEVRRSGSGADPAADFAEDGFDIAAGGAEGVAIDGEGGTDDDEGSAVERALDGLFEGEPADGLDGDGDGGNDLAELVEGAGHAVACGGDAAAFVVADVVDDEVAAEVLEFAGSGDHVWAGHVVAHDLDAEVAAGFDDAFDGFGVGAGHDDDVGGTGFGHHFCFEVATVHGFEVCDDGDAWEGVAEGADPVEPFGEEEGSTGFEPIDAGAEGHAGGFEGFVDAGEVEGDLDDGLHGEESVGPGGEGKQGDCGSADEWAKENRTAFLGRSGAITGGDRWLADYLPASVFSLAAFQPEMPAERCLTLV